MTIESPPRARPSLERALRVRDQGIDRLRGAAILLMVVDHVLIVTGQATSPLRYTLTRAAMPLFVVIAGHLVDRITWRHGAIGVVGLGLPLLVPFVDSPNVLLWYALACPVILAARRLGPGAVAVLAVVPLTLAANGYDLWPYPGSYDPSGLLGLMAVGALVPRTAFTCGLRLPRLLAGIGRYPLSCYVGHLLVLTAVWHVV